MLRARTWFVVLVVVLGMETLGASTGSASGVACSDCSGTYTGSWTAQIQSPSPEGTGTYRLSLSWTEALNTAPGSVSGVWSLVSAQGTVSYTNSGDSSGDCNATLSPDAAIAADITQFGPAVSEGSTVAVNPNPPTYWTGNPTSPQPLLSSDDSDPECNDVINETPYQSGFWTSFTGSGCHHSDAVSFPIGTTTTVPDNCDVVGSDGSGATGTGTLTSQLTLTAPGPSSCAVAAGVHGAHRAARAGARVASRGSLSATVTSVPRGFAGQVTLLAIGASDGRIVATRALASGATRTILSLPSNRYAILADAASAADRPHNHEGIGPLVAVRAGRRATVRVALGRLRADADVYASRDTPGHLRPDDRATGHPLALAAAASGAVVTVNGISLTFPDGSRVSLDDPALTDLFPAWHDQDGITFVETGKQFTDFTQREQELSDSGRLEPPYHFDPITPDFTISGDARIDRKGRMSLTIEVRDRCSGQVIDRITITRRLRGGLGSIRYDAGIASALRDALSRLQPPSATSGCGCA